MPVIPIRAILLTILLALASGHANAAPPAFCSIAASGVNFGAYLPDRGALSFTGKLRVTCSTTASFTVALTGGMSGNPALRQMRLPGGAMLRYQLYQDAAHTRVWGDGGMGALAGPFIGTGAELTVFGLLHGSQRVPAGAATDLLTAIVNY